MTIRFPILKGLRGIVAAFKAAFTRKAFVDDYGSRHLAFFAGLHYCVLHLVGFETYHYWSGFNWANPWLFLAASAIAYGVFAYAIELDQLRRGSKVSHTDVVHSIFGALAGHVIYWLFPYEDALFPLMFVMAASIAAYVLANYFGFNTRRWAIRTFFMDDFIKVFGRWQNGPRNWVVIVGLLIPNAVYYLFFWEVNWYLAGLLFMATYMAYRYTRLYPVKEKEWNLLTQLQRWQKGKKDFHSLSAVHKADWRRIDAMIEDRMKSQWFMT